jgi:hypothetical protein
MASGFLVSIIPGLSKSSQWARAQTVDQPCRMMIGAFSFAVCLCAANLALAQSQGEPVFSGLPCPLAATSTSTSQAPMPYNLAGEWNGRFGVPGSPGRYQIERVRIYQNGDRVTAVKVTGNVVIPSGKITFCGDYRSNSFDIRIQRAALGYVNPDWLSARLTVVDENHLRIDTGQTYERIGAAPAVAANANEAAAPPLAFRPRGETAQRPDNQAESPPMAGTPVGSWRGIGRIRGANLITTAKLELRRVDGGLVARWSESLNDRESIRLRLKAQEDATGFILTAEAVEQRAGATRLCSSFDAVKFNRTAAGELYANLNLPIRPANAPGCAPESFAMVSDANPHAADIVDALLRGGRAFGSRDFGEAIRQYEIAAGFGNGLGAFVLARIYSGDPRLTGIANGQSQARRWDVQSYKNKYIPARHYMICDGVRTKNAMISLINALFDDPSFIPMKVFGAGASYLFTRPNIFTTYSFDPTADFGEGLEDEFLESPFTCNLIVHMRASLRNPFNASAEDRVGEGLLNNFLGMTPTSFRFTVTGNSGGSCSIEIDSQYAARKFAATVPQCDEP